MDAFIKKLDHFVVYTDNVKSILDFYKKLGFEEGEEQSKPVLIGQNFKIKIHGPASTAKPVPKTISKGSIDICFESTLNPEEIADYLKKQGIPIFEGPVPRIGFQGNMISTYILDPEGNLIELSHYNA